ncbi:MAG: hypothetical protein ABIQ09_15300 [Jatrophihabitantaceae bacterium]
MDKIAADLHVGNAVIPAGRHQLPAHRPPRHACSFPPLAITAE